jgi:hypothetical protein
VSTIPLDRDTLNLWSVRAQAMLARARRTRSPRSPEDCARKLAAVGRTPLPAVLAFEELFGGIAYETAAGACAFGVELDKPDPYPDRPDDPEHHMIPIGRGEGGFVRYYMNELGEVAARPDNEGGVTMKHASFLTFIEHEAMAMVPRWPEPRFGADLMGIDGAALAARLGLASVAHATDAYEAWWEDDVLSVQRTMFADNWRRSITSVRAASLGALRGAMDAAMALSAEVVFKVSGEPSQARIRRKREAWPDVEGWAAIPGAKRYPYGDGADSHIGAIWTVEKAGALTMEQYRIFRAFDGKTELRGWDSFGEDGAVLRAAR